MALLTTLLDKRTAFHTAVISEHLSASDPSTLQRVELMTQGLVAKGMTYADAHAGALKMLAGSVKLQAYVMSFADTFWATAVLIACGMPLVLLLGKPKKGEAPIAISDH